MDTKRVALIAIFTALAVALSPGISRIRIPSPFFGLPYQVWEIPIFVAFLVVGPKSGLFVACAGSVVLVAFQPTFIAVAGVLACFAMLGGFYLAYKLVTRNVPQGITPSTRKTVIATTAGGIIFRVLVMAVQNYYTLPIMLPLMGYNVSQSFMLGVVIPLVAIFNMTEPLYVIPISYFIGKAIGSNLKIGNKI
jgi:riboflavin transporter FmnP